MNIKEYMAGLDAAGREQFARLAGTTVGTLFQVRGGHSTASLELAVKIEIASGGKVPAESLRPDLVPTIAYMRRHAA